MNELAGSDPAFLAFFAFCVALGLGALWLLRFNRNAGLKRRLYPAILVSAGLVFVAFVLRSGGPAEMLVLMVPMIALITFLNWRTTRFCDGCGETIGPALHVPKFCWNCGAPLA